MKITVHTGLNKSPLTGAMLGRCTLCAESKDTAYYAIYEEGSAIKSVMIPLSDNPSKVKRLDRLLAIAGLYQDAMDKVFIASDYEAFKNGRPAPIAAGLYWEMRNAVEKEVLV